MLQVNSIYKLDRMEVGLPAAVAAHGGKVDAVARMAGTGALVFTLDFPSLYAALLKLDLRFAAYLPVRVAACPRNEGTMLLVISPREFCRTLHRPEFEASAAILENVLRAVLEETCQSAAHGPELPEVRATEEQINMRAALPQRIDAHGTKVEELAGTGCEAQGG